MHKRLYSALLVFAVASLAIVLEGCAGIPGAAASAATPSGDTAQSFQVTVTKTGNGSVASAPAGIQCGATCQAPFGSRTSVTLTATPDNGWSFSGWSGACSGTGVCTLTISADASATATFTQSGGGNTPPPPPAATPVSVLTYKYDLARDGLNDQETTLTPAKVGSNFGKLFSYKLDGIVFAQPLYMPNVVFPTQGTHNVVFVATEHDTVYALDADSNQPPLWHVNFADPDKGVTSVPTTVANDTGGRTGLGPEVGITGTPVIDPMTNTLYVSAMTYENGQAVHRLHALDIYTGAEKFGGPVTITATVPGNGVGNNGAGQITFYPLTQNQRPALTLVNGVLYIAFASFSDIEPYHGWIFAYDSQTLKQLGVFMATPNGEGAGIWQGASGLAADKDGNLYVATADGTFDNDTGGKDYGDSLLKLRFSDGTFNVLDSFTPFNQNCLNRDDLDFGSGGPALLPESGVPQMLVIPNKEGRVYVVDRNNMGHYRTDEDSQILDWLLINPIACTTSGGLYADGPQTNRIYGSVGYFNNSIYVGPANTALRRYTVSAEGKLQLASQTTNSFQTRGVAPVISANGTDNAMVWVAEYATDVHLLYLRAYDATDLSKELYASTSAADAIGRGPVFTVPVVANGKVYVGGAQSLTVFGLK